MADVPQDTGGFSVRDQFAGKDGLLHPVTPPRPLQPHAVGQHGQHGHSPLPSRPPRNPSLPPIRVRVTMENIAKLMDWKKVLRGLLRRAWIIGIVTGGFLTLGIVAGVRSVGMRYDASISLLYRPDRQKQMLAAAGSSFMTKGLSRTTAVSMLCRSRNMEQVQATLHPPLTVSEMLFCIQAQSDKGSDIVRLVFTGASSGVAAVNVLNELGRVAMSDNATFYRSQAEQIADAFHKQASAAQKDLDRLTEALATYQAANHLIEPSADAQAFLTTVATTAEKLSAARIACESQATRIESYRQTIVAMPDEVLRESLEDNPLKRRISNTEVALMEARTKYGTANPRVQSLEDEIKETRRMLTGKTYDQTRERIFEPNPTKTLFQTELLRMEAERNSLQKNVQKLEAERAAVEQRFAFLPRQQIEVSAMQQQRKEAEERYHSMGKTAENAAMAASLDLADFEILEPARNATARLSKKVWLFPAAGLFAGFSLSFMLVLLRELLDPKLRTAHQVELAYTVPCLGMTEHGRELDPESMYFRFLPISRTLYKLNMRNQEALRPRSLAVLSSTSGEGKSSLAFQIAKYWARCGIKTACVDFNAATNPAIKTAEASHGIEEYLRGTTTWDQIVSIQENVACLKLRQPTPEMPELLHSDAMARFWSTLRATYPFVIIETPGIVEDRSGALLAGLADQCIFVIASPLTNRLVANTALDRLDLDGLRPVGIVLNMADPFYMQERGNA